MTSVRFHMIPDGKLLVEFRLSEAPFPCLELCPVFYSSAPHMDQQSKESSGLRPRSGVRFLMASGNGCRTLQSMNQIPYNQEKPSTRLQVKHGVNFLRTEHGHIQSFY